MKRTQKAETDSFWQALAVAEHLGCIIVYRGDHFAIESPTIATQITCVPTSRKDHQRLVSLNGETRYMLGQIRKGHKPLRETVQELVDVINNNN